MSTDQRRDMWQAIGLVTLAMAVMGILYGYFAWRMS